MLVFLGQLLLLLVDIVMASEDQFNSGIFRINPDKIDTKLDGYNIRTFEKISPRMCFDKCLRRPKCHSYNYNRHILRCELNFRPKCVSGIDFHNEVGFVYVDVGHYRGVSINFSSLFANDYKKRRSKTYLYVTWPDKCF